MSEKNLWNKLRATIQRMEVGGRWERVENGVGSGMPDVSYCVKGREGWIELKHGRMPSKDSTEVFKSQRGLDITQINWHYNQHQAGGQSFILIELDSTYFWFKGAEAERINKLTMGEMAFNRITLSQFLSEILRQQISS